MGEVDERAAFCTAHPVSRETLGRLETYATLLRKWTPRINLVAKSTCDQVWSRHFQDSAQLLSLRPAQARLWADLGSGGGFPGLVVAVLAAEKAPELTVALVESDLRKAAFLREAVRALGLSVRVHGERIERLAPLRADVVSARALAPLPILVDYAARHLAPGGVALFPKGASVAVELAEALATRSFSVQKHPSETNENAVILKVGELSSG